MSGMMWTEEEGKGGGSRRRCSSVGDVRNVGGASERVSGGTAGGKHAEAEMCASPRMEGAAQGTANGLLRCNG